MGVSNGPTFGRHPGLMEPTADKITTSSCSLGNGQKGSAASEGYRWTSNHKVRFLDKGPTQRLTTATMARVTDLKMGNTSRFHRSQ